MKFLKVLESSAGLNITVPLEVLKTLYCSLILPYVSYCNIVWGNTFRTNLDKLIVLQKRAARIITNSPYRAHNQPILQDLKYLSIVNFNKYQQALFMYKYSNNLLCLYLVRIYIITIRERLQIYIITCPNTEQLPSNTLLNFQSQKYGIAYHCLTDIQIHTTLLNENLNCISYNSIYSSFSPYL